MAELVFTILGCGSSGGVPRLPDLWGACDPKEPKNRRRRCSLLIERHSDGGTTRVLVDTSPDLREQLLSTKTGTLDGVVYTHSHADHVHGLDDLRMVVFNMRRRLPVWADRPTQADLFARFGYAFVQPEGSHYPPICEMNLMDGPFTIEGPGGPVTLTPFEVQHGAITALGLRVANVAYLPDVSDIPPENWAQLEGLDCWILDALRRDPHPSHTHLARSLDWIARAAPKRAVLTNMHIDLDYATLVDELPDGVSPAFDGMTVRVDD